MAFSVILVVLVLVVGGLILAAALGGSRALPWVVGGAVLLVLGGAGFFLLGRTAAVRVATAPVVVAVPAVPAAPASVPVVLVRDLRGRVLRGAEGETPVPGASVEAFAADAGPVPFAPCVGAISTGPDGRFVLERVPAGGLNLRASAPGLASAVVARPAGEGTEAVIRLLPGTFLAGRVTDRETKEPLEGARVVVAGAGVEGAAGAASGADGSFRIEGAPRGAVSVTATAKDYGRHREGAEIPEWGRTGLEIRLRPGCSVSGTVRLPDGSPAAGAKVRASSLTKVPVLGEVPVPAETDPAVAGADGAWRLEGLPAGRGLRLTASTDDLLGVPADVAALAKGEERGGVELRLEPGGAVAAIVRDAAGAPIEGAGVSASPPEEEGRGNLGMMRILTESSAASAKTGADGKALVRPVRPGALKVRAEKQDWRSAESAAVAAAGQETPVFLVLEPGSSIAGRVLDRSGAPVPGASITAMSFGGGEPSVEKRLSGEDGSFKVGGLPSRAVMLRAEKQGFVPSSLNNVQPGTEKDGNEVIVTLDPAGAVTGTVSDPQGRPVALFRAMARKEGEPGANPMDWERFAAERAGEEFHDGRFRIEGLAPGRYEIEARAEGFAPGRAGGVGVEAGKDSAVAVVLSEGESLSGVVLRKADGTPVAGARVRIPAEGVFGEFDMDMDFGALEEVAGDDVEQTRAFFGAFGKGEATTGADGRFRLAGLEKGTLRLMVSAKGHSPQTVRGLEVPASQDVKVELAEESAIEGQVTDARGQPKQGAMVMLQKLPMFMRMASTDAEGRYRIGGVGAGNYLFYVMEQGAGFSFKSESVQLEEGKTTRKDHKLGEGTKVVGTVTRGGKPVDGVTVMLIPSARSGGPMGMLTGGGGAGFSMGATRPDGTFEITGVSPGRYAVTVQSNMGGTPGGSGTVDVAAGATEVRHDVVLPEAAIRGVVVDEEGSPVAGAAVTATIAGMDGGRVTDLGSSMQALGGQAFSDDAGAFHIADMQPGTYRLRVQAEGRGTEIVEGASSTSGSPVRVVLRRGAELSVRVLGPDGAPVRGATLFLEDAEGRELTNLSNFDAVRTNDQGRATLRAPPGEVTVEAAARGFAPGSQRTSVPSSEEVTLRLARGATVRVKVTGPGGAAVAGAGVELLDASGNPWGQRFSMDAISDLLTGSSTASDGTWTRGDLPAGTWTVRAVTQDGRSAEQRVTLAEGETAEATLSLR